jgi:hypothetical protein
MGCAESPNICEEKHIMKRIHLIAAATVIGLAGGTLGLVATAPAHAATASAVAKPADAPANCPAGATCGYTGENYTGREGILQGDNSNLEAPGDVWENIESVFNHGNSCNVVLFTDTGYNPDGGGWFLNREIGGKNGGLPDIASVNEGLWHHVYSNLWVGCS